MTSGSGVEAWVVGLVGRPEVFVAVAAVLALGAVLTFLPTQSLVVATGALLIARGHPFGSLMLLAVASVIGMVVGDLFAYSAARVLLHAPHRRRRLRRRVPRVLASIESRVHAFRERFDARPFVTVVIGRLVPTGRIATDLLAADAREPSITFTRMAAAGAVVFTGFCVVLAVLAGPFVERDPLTVATGAVIASLLVGALIDEVDQRMQRRRTSKSAA